MRSLRPTFPRKTPDASDIEDPDVVDLPAVRFRCRPRSYPCSRHVAKALHEADLRMLKQNFHDVCAILPVGSGTIGKNTSA